MVKDVDGQNKGFHMLNFHDTCNLLLWLFVVSILMCMRHLLQLLALSLRYPMLGLIMLLVFSQGIDVSDDILKIKQEIEAELFGEEQNWGRGESSVSLSSQNVFLLASYSFSVHQCLQI